MNSRKKEMDLNIGPGERRRKEVVIQEEEIDEFRGKAVVDELCGKKGRGKCISVI